MKTMVFTLVLLGSMAIASLCFALDTTTNSNMNVSNTTGDIAPNIDLNSNSRFSNTPERMGVSTQGIGVSGQGVGVSTQGIGVSTQGIGVSSETPGINSTDHIGVSTQGIGVSSATRGVNSTDNNGFFDTTDMDQDGVLISRPEEIINSQDDFINSEME